jgi:hypothetical protein
MSKPTSLFAAISLALAVVSIVLWQQLRDERALTAQLREQAAHPALLQVVPEVLTTATPAPASASAPAPAMAPTDVTAQAPARVVASPLIIDPRNKQATMALRYPDLAQQLGLTPEQAEALYDFLLKQQADQRTHTLIMGTGGQVSGQSRREIEDFARQQEADLEAYLGPASQLWKQYEPTLEARRRISELRAMVESSGEPLTEVQKQPLLNTILAEQQRRAQEEQLLTYPNMDQHAKMEMAMQNLKGREQSYQRIVNSASAYLTASQLATMKAAMDRQIQNERAVLKAQLAQVEGAR